MAFRTMRSTGGATSEIPTAGGPRSPVSMPCATRPRESDSGVDFADVRAYVDHNDAGTAAMLWSLHDAGFIGRLVLASSMVVYGEGAYQCPRHDGVRPAARVIEDLAAGRFEPGCPRCGDPVTWRSTTEDTPTDPRNVYAATKLHQEHLCSAFGREHGVAVTALRYHNVYGPRMPRDTPYAGVASLFRSRLAAAQPPLIFEDGGQTRDFVHVHDVARANVLALDCARLVRRCPQHRQRSPHHRPGDGERHHQRVRVTALAGRHRRLPPRRRAPRRGQPATSSRRPRLPRRDRTPRGLTAFADAPLRRPREAAAGTKAAGWAESAARH